MNRHELARQLIHGLLASGHFTLPQFDGEPPRLIVDQHLDRAFFPVVEEAYRLAGELLELEKLSYKK